MNLTFFQELGHCQMKLKNFKMNTANLKCISLSLMQDLKEMEYILLKI